MTEFAFSAVGKPATQGSKNQFGGESNKNLRPWRESVKHSALDAIEAAGWQRVEGPVNVWLRFYFDKPKSAPKGRRTWPITRSSGDIDKLSRAVLDALVDAGVMRDDSQVVDLVATKDFVGPRGFRIPGVRVLVSTVEADDGR